MHGVHPVPLDTVVQFFTGITSTAHVDVCLIKGNLFDAYTALRPHGFEDPVKERFRISIPPRASGYSKDPDGHSLRVPAD